MLQLLIYNLFQFLCIGYIWLPKFFPQGISVFRMLLSKGVTSNKCVFLRSEITYMDGMMPHFMPFFLNSYTVLQDFFRSF
jgi:hypothetical protein